MDLDNQQLIEEFLAGDQLAYEKILEKHLKSVYNFLRTFVHDQDVLDDLTQLTFIKAWKNLKSFDTKKITNQLHPYWQYVLQKF